MTDEGIARELGGRLKKLRLRRNLTQEELADRAMLSVSTVKAMESGKAKLASLIAVLRELGGLDELDSFLADPGISPMQLAKMQGKQRQRATGTQGRRKRREQPGDETW